MMMILLRSKICLEKFFYWFNPLWRCHGRDLGELWRFLTNVFYLICVIFIANVISDEMHDHLIGYYEPILKESLFNVHLL